MRRRLLAAAAALATAAAHAGPNSPPETALADYVSAPDDGYAWRVHARFQAAGAEVVELRLHSQTWRDVLWKHQLHLIKPDTLDEDSRQGVLIIGGGRWRSSYDTEPPASELPEDAGLFIGIARELEAVVAVVGQVPFQPLFGLREDDLIAHTFVEYLETGDAEWPLLLPMVKAAAKAMDATQAFASEEWNLRLERFTVTGGSKRGWTTWLTGAVDPRAAAIAPLVIDVLNFEAHMPHQEAVWGQPSEQISPYTNRGLDDVLGSDAGRDLRRIVDPYSYREQLTQPKLIVVATNDAYFPLDALNLYWDDLEGPKHVLYLPNEEHGIEDLGRLIPALDALHRSSARGTPMPELEWEFERGANGLRLCVRGNPRPSAVTAWTARSEDTDFRDERFSPRPMATVGDVYIFEQRGQEAAGSGPRTEPGGLVEHGEPAVAQGAHDAAHAAYRAVFAEAVFGSGDESYMLSTNVRTAGPSGEPPFPATAIVGQADVCPEG